MDYENKYLKYKNKYLKLQQNLIGGLIAKYKSLQHIVSIGFEFETNNLSPLLYSLDIHDIHDIEHLIPLDKYYTKEIQKSDNVSFYATGDSRVKSLINNQLLDDERDNKLQSPIVTIDSNNFNINFIKPKGFFRVLEYLITYYEPIQEQNIILTCFKQALEQIISYHRYLTLKESKLCYKGKCSSIYTLNDNLNKLVYLDTNKNLNTDSEIPYVFNSKTIRFGIQATFGVKLINMAQVLIYLARGNEDNEIINKCNKKARQILKSFSKYSKNINIGTYNINCPLYNWLFLVIYHVNRVILWEKLKEEYDQDPEENYSYDNYQYFKNISKQSSKWLKLSG